MNGGTQRAFLCAAALLQLVLSVGCGGGGSSAPPPVRIISVSVSPNSATAIVLEKLQFRATVSGTSNTSVTWAVNGIPGGDSSVGTIDATGMYTAPAVPPSPNAVTVKATSVADPTRVGTASVTIVSPIPVLNSISPPTVDAGSTDITLTVTGTSFTPQSAVQLSGTPLTTTFGSATQLTAVISPAQLTTAGSFPVTVVTPSPGGGTSNATNLTIVVVVTVSPSTQTLNVTQTQPFTATVTGSTNQSVTWSVSCAAGGAACGSIDSGSGLYTAPAVPPSSDNTVTVKASSVATPSGTGSASVTVISPVPVLNSISPPTVDAGSTDITLTVTGTSFTPQSTVQLSGTSLVTTFASSAQLTAVISAAQLTTAGTFPVTVVTPSPGGGTSNATNLTIVVVVTVSPATQTLEVTQTQPFTATVTGSTNQSVTWSVSCAAGGAACGSIDSGSGLYTAPAVPPSSDNTVTVKASSVATPSGTGSASVALTNPAPGLGSISPTNVDAGSGDTPLTVNGTGFAQQAGVRFNSTPLATTFGSATQLTAVIPAAQLTTAGSFPVTVVTPSPGGGTSGAVNLAVHVVVAVTPPTQTLNVTETQPLTATVTGSSNQAVTWSVNDIAGGSATLGTITASGLYTAPAVPPSPNNTVTVKAASVVDPSRMASASVTVISPVPVLDSISPSTVNAGSTDTTLTVTGASFTPQSTVQLSGTSLVTTFASSAQLTAVIPAAQLTTAGTFPVTVVTPSPGGGTSNATNLTIVVVVTVSPATQTLNVTQTQPFTATVTGSTNQSVTWSVSCAAGGAACGSIDSGSGLYTAPAVPPSSDNTVTVKATGAVDTNQSGTATATVVNPAPAISSISPLTINTGSGDTPLTVNGTGFAQQSVVRFNGTPLATTFGSATQLTAVIPAAQLTTAGTFPVTVVTPSPGGGTSNAVDLPVVVVVTVSPSTQTLNVIQTQPFTATVTGSTNQSVTWSVNGVTGGNTTVGTINASGLYTAPAVPPSPNNTVTVTASSVATPSGTSSASVAVINPAPGLSSISPTNVDAGSGDTPLTVNGTGFAQQAGVRFNGTPLATTFGSATQLTAVIPAAQLTTAGTFPVTVVTPTPGGGTSGAVNLAVHVVVAVSPPTQTLNVTETQPFTATVTGSSNQAVTWSVNDIAGGSATLGTITASGLYTAPAVPPSPNNTVTVKASSVATPSGTGSASVTVVNPVPVLYSISPNAVTAGDGDTTLTVTGSGFAAQSVVYADATTLATVFVGSTQLRATLPSAMLADPRTLTITVVTPGPGGGVSTGIAFKIWPSYPRDNAGSVLRSPPLLGQIPIQGTTAAVLDWTSKDSEGTPEDLLATCHSLSPMGIPHVHPSTQADASAYPFLAIAGVLNTASSLSSGERTGLITYVQTGGTLYLWAPSVTALLTDLGISGYTPYTGDVVRPVTFDLTQTDPILDYIDNSVEINWQPNFPSGHVTRGYTPLTPGPCTPLAWWNNTGDAAVLRCNLGTGRAYVFGWRLRPLLTLPERQFVPGIEPPNTNAVVLDADICRLLMRGSYEGFAPSPQIRQFAPEGHHAALIITHDVDAIVAYDLVPAYVGLENSLGVKSTFLFTTTPYDTDFIAPMYVASGMENIQYALNWGFDIASHSFGHFPDFDLAPLGTGAESAANYVPMYDSVTGTTSGMSTIGELGVSRWLLENDFGITVKGFRSGYLYISPDFLQGLSQTGYQRDSTYAYGLTRGAFPFATFDVSSGVVTTYPVVEYPVDISDEYLDATTYTQYLDKWKAVIQANYANNAPTILLLHPVDDTYRIQAEQEIIQWATSSYPDLWIGDWKTFAEFWEAQGVTCARWP
jgi:hypothetical protein